MDLLKDNIGTLYRKFLIPSLGSAMVLSIYTLVDAVVIGNGVGADALAALSITTPLLCVLMATGILFGVGGSVRWSVCRGRGDMKTASKVFTAALFGVISVTIALWLIYGFFAKDIVRYMGANETLYPYVMDYMRFILYNLPAVTLSNFVAIFIRADTDPNRAMAGVITGGMVNIVLDIVMVYPLHSGIGGAAFASILGMTVQVCIGCTHFISGKNTLIPSKDLSSLKLIGGVCHSGIPSLFNELANGVIVFLFNIQILAYLGTSALAIYSVISNVVILFNSLFTGVGQAIQPVTATNFGARQMKRVSHIKRLAFRTIIVMGAVFSATGIISPVGVASVFLNVTDTLAHIASYGIRIYSIAFLPMSINVLTTYYLQSVMRTKESLLISALRNIVLSAAGIIAVPLFLPANCLWGVMPVVEIIVLVISIILMNGKSKLVKK